MLLLKSAYMLSGGPGYAPTYLPKWAKVAEIEGLRIDRDLYPYTAPVTTPFPSFSPASPSPTPPHNPS